MNKIICMFVVVLLLLTGCGKQDQSNDGNSDSIAAGGSSDTYSAGKQNGNSNPDSSVRQNENPSSPASFPAVSTITITIPEGYTLARIGMLLEEKGICTVDAFITAAQTYDFSGYSLIAAQTPDSRRCFSLEGYLFPDTYTVSVNDTPQAIIQKMLANTEQRFNAAIRSRIAQSGYTIDEIITMASIIEKEAFGQTHMINISSVLHNRLNASMQLQCDATITYVEGAIKPFITGDINRYNSDYNTYKCAGLPAGAICNPGIAAIEAALNPAGTNYLYFVTDASKNYYYAATWEEHQQNLEMAGLL